MVSNNQNIKNKRMKLQYNIRSKIWLVSAILVAISISSCKKLIEIPSNPSAQILQSTVYNDSADIMSAVAGVYVNFKVSGGGNNIFSGMMTQYIGCASDELSNVSGNTFLTNTYLATDATASQFWTTGYQNIYYINACLSGIASTTAISESLKQSLLGELKMVRAMSYFYLVNLYGAVPIVTSTDYTVNAVLPRSSVDSVYNFILSDLTDAHSALKATYPSAGRARPNLYTADALLARLYLYRGQYTQAEAMASEIINSGLYSLTALTSVFVSGSKEAIWQLPAIGVTSQTTEASAFIPFSPSITPSWQVTTGLLNSFELNDLRKTSWVGTSTISTKNYYYPLKYRQQLATATPADGYVVFRLAEQYLIRAEARAQQNKPDSALADLNVIRKRAGLGNSTASTTAQILTAVIQERRTELFCEWGHRWFDLIRSGTINTVMSTIKTGWAPTAALLPVPATDIQNDPFLTQNPGY